MKTVLWLGADYQVKGFLPWQKAVEKLMTNKVRTEVAYEGKVIRSESLTIPFPAVIVELQTHKGQRSRVRGIRLGLRNLAARDNFQCQYCGYAPVHASGRPDIHKLQMEHVVPRAQAVRGQVLLPWSKRWVPVSCWENIVASCSRCNLYKGPRTPDEAGMSLRRIPQKPKAAEILRSTLRQMNNIPSEWVGYLPSDLCEG